MGESPCLLLPGLHWLPLAFPASCFVSSATTLHTAAGSLPCLKIQWCLTACGAKPKFLWIIAATPCVPGEPCQAHTLSLSHPRHAEAGPSRSLCDRAHWAPAAWKALLAPPVMNSLWFVSALSSGLPISLSATSSRRLFLRTCLKPFFFVTLYQIPLFISSIVLITVWNIDRFYRLVFVTAVRM